MQINQPFDDSINSDTYQQPKFRHNSIENRNHRIDTSNLEPWVTNIKVINNYQTENVVRSTAKLDKKYVGYQKTKYQTLNPDKIRVSGQQNNLSKRSTFKAEYCNMNFFKSLTKNSRQFLRSSITQHRSFRNSNAKTQIRQSNQSFREKQFRLSIEENKRESQKYHMDSWMKQKHLKKFEKFMNSKNRSISPALIGQQQGSMRLRKTKNQQQCNNKTYSENKLKKNREFSAIFRKTSQKITNYKQKSAITNSMILAKQPKPKKANKKLIILHKYSFLKGNSMFKRQNFQTDLNKNQNQNIKYALRQQNNAQQINPNPGHINKIIQKLQREPLNNALIGNGTLSKQGSQSMSKSPKDEITEFDKKCDGILAIGVSKNRNERYKNYKSVKKKIQKSVFTFQTHLNDDKGTFILQSSDINKMMNPKGTNSFNIVNKQVKSLRRMKMQKQQSLVKHRIKISMNSEKKLDPRKSFSILSFPAH